MFQNDQMLNKCYGYDSAHKKTLGQKCTIMTFHVRIIAHMPCALQKYQIKFELKLETMNT